MHDLRFITMDGTVEDRKSGLIWLQDAGVSEFPLRWQEALEKISELNALGWMGCSDWRMPTRDELFSLISHAHINPCLPEGHPFLHVSATYYWTSTTCSRLPQQAWYIHLGGARVFKGGKDMSYMLWPVRGSMRICTPEALEEMSGSSFDQRTGLMWSRDADLFGRVTWEQAKERIEAMNTERWLGVADWRLPDVRELASLADLRVHSPALPPEFKAANVRKHYWSATTSAYEATYAWCLYLQDGAIGVGFKANPEFYVWPVRGTREDVCAE